MSTTLLNSLHLKGFLSFGPESEPVKLTGLNVLIGPNGVGKSNFIEAVELLHSTPADFAGAIHLGGLPIDWVWSGDKKTTAARIEARLSPVNKTPELRYAIEFTESADRLEIVDEVLEESKKKESEGERCALLLPCQRGHPHQHGSRCCRYFKETKYKKRTLKRETIDPQQSIFSQMKDRDLYPEVTTAGLRFKAIQIFREWSFGRSAALRSPQAANLPTDVLLPQLVNLGLGVEPFGASPGVG